ncbi:MAG: trehalose-6-phosphate hydrolase [Lasallia pustulata]|uniref:Trehalose-6-phosphate hydrolase n=2 Tax=Lasallia pustulata TaxID=136370 RepID=A0A5M8Q421_9LECA|nr:MAG: trehalose-6-phosphate hydrolase [Lasallia pustulata]
MLKQPSNGLSNGAGGSHDHANHVPRAWRKEASVYQVYPSSFKDSNGDGIGDIPGITSKVGYIQQLGVDIVWLCPIFKSPQADMGYDISDYCHVHEPHGTIENVEELIQGLHSPGMKCLLDLVVNHTSDQVEATLSGQRGAHNWFEQSRSSLSNSHRDWYIWRKPKYDSAGNRQPPNNWKAIFGGSAWEYDEQTDEYYLHLFLKEQPDLKWDHPPVRDAVCEVMRFWLDRGCDGFRIDAINFISKPPGLPDDRSENRWNMLGLEHYANGPRLHEYLKVIGGVLREYDAFSVGDMGHLTDLDEVLRSVGADRGELAMVFHFEIMDMDHGSDFTTGTPWMRVNEDYAKWNAESQVNAPDSVFQYYPTVLQLRKEYKDIFVYGEFKLLAPDHQQLFVHKRMSGSKSAVVVMNFKETGITFEAADLIGGKLGKVLLSNYAGLSVEEPSITLGPFGAFVALLS